MLGCAKLDIISLNDERTTTEYKECYQEICRVNYDLICPYAVWIVESPNRTEEQK